MSVDFLDALINEAEQLYRQSRPSFWLAAVADGVPVAPCQSYHEQCGSYVEGSVWLPMIEKGSRLIPANLDGGRKFKILASKLIGEKSAECDLFLDFCGRVGAKLVSNHPAYRQPEQGGAADGMWIVALFDFFESSQKQIDPRTDKCQIVKHPWLATLLALKEWREGLKTTEQPISALLDAANNADLKGVELKLVTLIATLNGNVSIKDAELHCDGADVVSAFKRAKPKLKKHGWNLSQRDNHFTAEAVPSKGRK
jgi:hypothetical protein